MSIPKMRGNATRPGECQNESSKRAMKVPIGDATKKAAAKVMTPNLSNRGVIVRWAARMAPGEVEGRADET